MYTWWINFQNVVLFVCLILTKGVSYFCYKSATLISNLKGYQFCVSVGHFCCAISTSYDLLSKRGFCFCLWRCSTAVATVVSRVLCCYVHIPQLLTVKPVLVNRVVFRIARASPTRLLMAVKDKYTRIKCSCQIKKKKQCSPCELKFFLNEYFIFMDFQKTFIWK